MKLTTKLAILFLLCAIFPVCARANQSASGWCEAGAQTVTTGGIQSTTTVQASYPSCTVTVYIHGGGLATIYSDDNNTPLSNPFTANSNGQWIFFAANGVYDINMSGGSMPSTTISSVQLYDCVAISCGSGGGGGGSPAGNVGDLQDKVNSSTFGASHINDGGTYSGQMTASESLAMAGPDPYVDVRAYGAKGNAVTDDTAAIQAAINAACGNLIGFHELTVFFPPGSYLIDQPQTPSTAAPLTLCSGLHFVGSDSSGGGQFINPPQTQIIASAGASPNAAPIFQLTYPTTGATFKNLIIEGYNQAVGLAGSNLVNFDNVCLTSQATGLSENTPLLIDNAIWVRYHGGCLQTSSGTLPDMILTTTGMNLGTVQGLAFFDNMVWIGGGVQYIHQATGAGGTPGNDHFSDITVEDCAEPFFSITNTAGSGQLPQMSNLDFNNVDLSDCSGSDPIIYLNSTGTVLSDSTLSGDQPNAAGQIIVNAGSLNNITEQACGGATCAAVDGSGNPVAGVTIHSGYGFDVVASSSDPARLRDDLWGLLESGGPSFRACFNGGIFCGIGLDPSAGLLLGDQTNYGYNAQIYQSASTPDTLDIGFAITLPPTSVSATPTTGGTLAAGTYYYQVKSANFANHCGTPANNSSPSLPSSVTISGSSDAATITWSTPLAGTGTIVGYCVFRNSGPTWNDNYQIPGAYVSGAATLTFTDIGSNMGFLGFTGATNAMESVHRFTVNALGINTTSPAANSISLGVGGFLGSITHANSANRTYTLPDASGTLCLTSTCTGAFSGSIANSQIAFGSGTNSLQGTNNATMDSSGDMTLAGTLLAAQIGTAIKPVTLAYLGGFALVGSGQFNIQAQSGSTCPTPGVGVSSQICFFGPDNVPQVYANSQNNDILYSGGPSEAATYATSSNCSSSASPAACGSAAAGSFVIAAAATSVVVDTTAVTANSQIMVQPDDSLGTKLSVTCNTTGSLLSAEAWISARSAGTSFTVTITSAPSSNPECFSYTIVN